MTEAERYELIVKRLLETKLRSDPGIRPLVSHRKEYTGASRQSYEIDLAFETTLAESRVLVLIECKCYSRRVGVEVVSEFAYKVNDIGAHKGIIVTTEGFTSGAITITKREGIALVVAQNAWTVIVYSMTGWPAPNVIYNQDWSDFSYPKGSNVKYDGPPLRQYIYTAIGKDTSMFLGQRTLAGPELCFEPRIDGIDGAPFDILQAAAIFCIENDLSVGHLLDIRRFF